MEINQTISPSKLAECEHIASFGIYEIYKFEDVEFYLFAIDSNNLICSCFEFAELEDGFQLAHMHTITSLKGQGIGKQILSEAVAIFDSFELPSIDTDQTYYFVEDGLGWTRHCFDIGILKQPNFRRP